MNDPAGRAAALAKANHRRRAQSIYKHHIATLPPAMALEEIAVQVIGPDPDLGAIPLERLLRCVQGFGPHAVRRLLIGVPHVDGAQPLRDIAAHGVDAQLVAARILAVAAQHLGPVAA